MTAQGLAHVGDVHLEKRAVARATGGDEHVVDRCGDCFEKLLQGLRVVGIEGRGAQRADLRGRCVEPVRVSSGQNDFGAFDAGLAGGFKTDAGTAANDDDGLPGERRFALRGFDVMQVA